MKIRTCVLLLSLVSLAGCASQPPLPAPPPSPPPVTTPPPPLAQPEPPRETPDAPFRQSPPPAGAPVAWAPPRIEQWTTKSGVRVLFVERHDLPIVSVAVVTGAGAGDMAGVRAGLVPFMGAMLEQGAGKRDALALSDAYEALGAEHGSWCSWDTCGAKVKVLASRLPGALDLLADVTLRPTFPEAEVERVRKRWLGSLEQEKNSPGAMEQNAIAASVFGRAHPYGHSLRGQPEDARKFTRADVEQAWRRAFQPRSTTIVAAGDVTPKELEALLEARFGGWKGGAAVRAPVGHAPPRGKKDARVVLVDVPGAAQSQVFLAEEGAPFSTKDRIALDVMNRILGGTFSSRMNLELREDKQFTYGAHSRFAMRHGAGPFVAGAAIFAEHTGEAAKLLLAQVDRIRAQPVTAEELTEAKDSARLELPARFETVDDVASALEDIALYGLPLDTFAGEAAKIDAVTAADVQRVAKAWLRPESLRVVVAGDRARVEHGLTELGAVEARDPYGDPVK